MTIGTGIVLLGVWLCVAAAWLSKHVPAAGVWISMAVAIGMTVYLK